MLNKGASITLAPLLFGVTVASGIYWIQNKLNGKTYIGQSWDIEKRFRDHQYEVKYKNRRCANLPMYNAIRKYGWDNFEHKTLIIVANQEDMDRYEKDLIKVYNTLKPGGYNLREGGMGGKLHANTKAKLGARDRTGWKKQDLSTRLRGADHPLFGTTRPQSVKDAVSKANKGRLLSEERKEQNRQWTIANKTGKPSPLRGTKLSKEHSEKIAESKRGRKLDPVTRKLLPKS